MRYIAAFLVAFILISGSIFGQGTSNSQGGGMDIYQKYKQKKTYVFHPRPFNQPNKQPNNGQNGPNGHIYQSWKARNYGG